jgi:integrase
MAESEKKVRNQHRSKFHVNYWRSAVFRLQPGGCWWAQLQHRGRRQKFSLDTRVKAAAAARALYVYKQLQAGKSWDEAFATFRPEIVRRDPMTVGDLLDELSEKVDPNKLRGYAVAFRKIVSDIFKIDDGKAKFDYRSGGRQRWIDKVHAVRLADLTPERVQRWKIDFLKRAGDNPIRLRSARISVNSFLRRAKSLFSPELTKHLTHVPSSPFADIKFEPRQSQRYFSTINVEQLTSAATKELAAADPPAFLVFLLALGAGLRRLEIDRLEWSAFQWDKNTIHIGPTAHFDVKTEHSLGDIPIDDELMSIFRGYHAKAKSNFVIESPTAWRKGAMSDGYRAEKIFDRLIEWLRGQGITAKKPLHTLRKEFGSQLCAKAGIYVASRMLRHADIAITAQHYLDQPRQATSGLGALLKTANDGKIVPIEEETCSGIAEMRRR